MPVTLFSGDIKRLGLEKPEPIVREVVRIERVPETIVTEKVQRVEVPGMADLSPIMEEINSLRLEVKSLRDEVARKRDYRWQFGRNMAGLLDSAEQKEV